MKFGPIFLAGLFSLQAAAQWTGTYSGTVNGDAVTLTLQENGSQVNGELRDSQQTYLVTGLSAGSQLSGKVRAREYDLVFDLEAQLDGDQLTGQMLLDNAGQTVEIPLLLSRDAYGHGTNANVQVSASSLPFPPGAEHPSSLCATWTQNESYNSGQGDAFMGANFSQSMTFLPGGRLADGGSSASMSGSNYSGQSSGEGAGLLEGVGWFARGNQLYLLVFYEGNWQTAPLGRWYVENNHLLITADNGTKLLLSRS